MRKDLKEKLLAHKHTLYDKKWVEDTATEGFERLMKGMHEKEPELASAVEKCLWPFEIMYYTAFEDALNTFFIQCIGDEVTKVSLYLDKFHKITASFCKKLNG